ncbi:MAG TPA: hypothetical protein DCX08_08665 [Porticoccaceae bacterium]|jgi:uncharacterized membrane protein YeiH|nr:hypothetical protein [Porticoccaceae bacterium]
MPEQIIIQFLGLLNILGLVVFAISGTLFAAEKNMDILGVMLIGTATGIGGGTLRDLLLGISPVSWIQEPLAIYICLAACIITYFTADLHRRRLKLILWMDAIGLSAFAVLGTEIALQQQENLLIAIVMGVMSATFGGILRDVLCAKTLTLMRPELYITCALLASLVYVVMDAWGFNQSVIQSCSFVAGFGLRALAISYRLEIPKLSHAQD